jgi:hypothetical protein
MAAQNHARIVNLKSSLRCFRISSSFIASFAFAFPLPLKAAYRKGIVNPLGPITNSFEVSFR